MSDYQWVLFEPNGKITVSGTSGSRRVAEVQGTLGVDLVLHDTPNVTGATHYVDVEGTFDILTRPDTQIPEGGPVPYDMGLETYTDGTVMEITLNSGKVSFEAPGDGTRLEIDVPGQYPVRILPPFPEKPSSGVVEVTDA